MGIPRLISVLLLAAGLFLLGEDVANLLTARGGAPRPLSDLWMHIDSVGLMQAEAFAQNHLFPGVWDPGMVTLLKLPAWTLPIVIGLVILLTDVLTQRRGPKP